ncbi:NAD(P)/FAD-dependent oxidoreductase, partial [bacterium]|nr:NAD(P)/FAD-dependent oxidoreductase [bacterium]
MVMGTLSQEVETVVIGSGPGGYVAALRLAALGKEVLLIERNEQYGGTCLLEGCIPSKALINAVELKESAENAGKFGISFSGVEVDHNKLRDWTNGVVSTLSGGIATLLKKAEVEVMCGTAKFTGSNTLDVGGNNIEFEDCIIATGSSLNRLPEGIDQSVWSSADALKLKEVPGSLLVVGGGYIGLELGLVYQGLGSKVSVVEFNPRLLAGADFDLADIMIKRVSKRLTEVMTESRVLNIEPSENGFDVKISHNDEEFEKHYDQVLVAIGRAPNSDNLGLENTKVV